MAGDHDRLDGPFGQHGLLMPPSVSAGQGGVPDNLGTGQSCATWDRPRPYVRLRSNGVPEVITRRLSWHGPARSRAPPSRRKPRPPQRRSTRTKGQCWTVSRVGS
jgi:hypothetical protein